MLLFLKKKTHLLLKITDCNLQSSISHVTCNFEQTKIRATQIAEQEQYFRYFPLFQKFGSDLK